MSGLANNEGYVPVITSRAKTEVKDAASTYEKYHTVGGGNMEERKKQYQDMVNKYYDLATSFYEYGWGTSFHFAHRHKGESHNESIKRHEHYLALRLGLQPGHKVLDVGCGIGGPLTQIALFSGAHVTGLNNNAYQISRGTHYLQKAGHGLSETCKFVKGDFMNMPFEDSSFDAVYEIDATCHAPDQVGCYKEIARVLKPGACFAGYEWCATDVYDPKNPEHQKIMADIELGNGLPCVRTTEETKAALAAAGFEVIEAVDLALTCDVPWWRVIDQDRIGLDCISYFKTTRAGRWMTTQLVKVLEATRIAPEGSTRVQKFLEAAADGLVAGGKTGTYTTVYFFLARKL